MYRPNCLLIAAWLLVGIPLLTAVGRAEEPPAVDNPVPAKTLVMIAVTGELDGGPGQILTDDDQDSARHYVENLIGQYLVRQAGIRLMDEETMTQVRSEAEKWTVLTGGGISEVRKVLNQYAPEFLVRATLHSSPLTQVATGTERVGIAKFWACTAGITLEIIPRNPERLPSCVASPPRRESTKRLKPLETALVALESACREAVKSLLEQQVLAPQKDDGDAAAAAIPGLSIKNGKVILVTTGTFYEDSAIPATERELITRRIETELGKSLAAVFGLTTFDQETLAKARHNAQQWAVLQGGTIAEIRTALEPYALDACVRIRFHVPAPHLTTLDTGERIHAGTAIVTVETINLKKDRGTKDLIVESPPMGTNLDPAIRALAAIDAISGALTHCQERILQKLTSGDATNPGLAAENAAPADAMPTTPAAAVLWVKPDFKGWRVPRGRQPALTRKHQLQVNKFVENAKHSGTVGLEISDYLVHGLIASGALLPLENSAIVQDDIMGIKNKLLELRMAGWVGERLPYDDPLQAVAQIGALYAVTARITRIEEPQPTSAAMILASAARSEVRAWAEVVVTRVADKQAWTFTGEGVMSKTGWSTGITYTPELQLDETLFGGAIRQALFNAAAAIRLDQ